MPATAPRIPHAPCLIPQPPHQNPSPASEEPNSTKRSFERLAEPANMASQTIEIFGQLVESDELDNVLTFPSGTQGNPIEPAPIGAGGFGTTFGEIERDTQRCAMKLILDGVGQRGLLRSAAVEFGGQLIAAEVVEHDLLRKKWGDAQSGPHFFRRRSCGGPNAVTWMRCTVDLGGWAEQPSFLKKAYWIGWWAA